MGEKRFSKRVAFRNVVRFGPKNPPEFTSFLLDLSDTGVCIKTNNIFRPGTKLYLSIEVDGRAYGAEGVVMWAKKAPPGLVRHVKNGMGVKFTKVDEELIELYKKKKGV